MDFNNLKMQNRFKAIASVIVCILVALNFQSCSDKQEVPDLTIDPYSLEAVVVREKSSSSIVSAKNPVRIGQEYEVGLFSANVPTGVSLDITLMPNTTAVCTFVPSSNSQVIYQGNCSQKGVLALEIVLHSPDVSDTIMSLTLSVQDANSTSDITEFEFSGPSGNLTALDMYSLTYNKSTTPLELPTFSTLPVSTVRCKTLSHQAGRLNFICDRKGVWVVEGKAGELFAKIKSYSVVTPSSVTPYFLAQLNGVGSLKKLSTLTSSIPADASSATSTIKLYRPNDISADVAFSVQLSNQTGTTCVISGVQSGTQLNTITCIGTGQAGLALSIEWPNGEKKTSQHTLKIQ